MVKKRFKELRMLVFCVLLFLVFITIGLICLINKDVARTIIMLICSLVTLFLLVGRYNIILFDDYMMVYEYKIFAMLPILVEYKHIKDVVKKGKYKVLIKHKKRTHVYVLNSDQFIKSLEKCMK